MRMIEVYKAAYIASHPEYAAEIKRIEEETKRIEEKTKRLEAENKRIEARLEAFRKAHKNDCKMLHWTLSHKDDADVRKLLDDYPLLREQIEHSTYHLSKEDILKAEKWHTDNIDCMREELSSFYQRCNRALEIYFDESGPGFGEEMIQIDLHCFFLLAFVVGLFAHLPRWCLADVW